MRPALEKIPLDLNHMFFYNNQCQGICLPGTRTYPMALLTSKLRMPALTNTLSRERLTSLFSGLQHRLVLVTAGAGYGKTTLAAMALSEIRERVIWYRMDDNFNVLGDFRWSILKINPKDSCSIHFQ